MVMEVTVLSQEGIPSDAYLSIRAGSVRRQALVGCGKPFTFPKLGIEESPVKIDIMQTIGTAYVVVKPGEDRYQAIFRGGSEEELMCCEVGIRPAAGGTKDPPAEEPGAPADDAAEYLERHKILPFVRAVLQTVIKEKPEDPYAHIARHFNLGYDHHDYRSPITQRLGQTLIATAQTMKQPEEIMTKTVSEGDGGGCAKEPAPAKASPAKEVVAAQPIQIPVEVPPGSAASDQRRPAVPEMVVTPTALPKPVVRKDGTLALPDLSGHHSVLASVLKDQPSLFNSCSSLVTPLGVPLMACIRTGIENRGHPMLKTVGAVAGDEYCYTTFKDILEPILDDVYGGSLAGTKHEQDFDPAKVAKVAIDPVGMTAVGVVIRGSRSLRGMRMPPAIDRDERLQAERLIVGALLDLGGDLEGEYSPLGSECPLAPGGMPPDREAELQELGLMLEQPDAPASISAGFAREWPEARGVFVNKAHTLAAWVNGMEHLELVSRVSGSNIQDAFDRFVRAERALGAALKETGAEFATHERFGYLNASLLSIGTGLTVAIVLLLPEVSARDDFHPYCKELGVKVRRALDYGPDAWEMVAAQNLGCTAVGQVNAIAEAARTLVDLERRCLAKDAPRELCRRASSALDSMAGGGV